MTLKKKLAITILFFLIIYIFFPNWTQEKAGGEDGIYLLQQVEIEGSMHQMLIRGEDVKNPVLLCVSGEDEFSEIAYITKYQKQLEKKFTVIWYDKRGTGKTDAGLENRALSIDQMTDDLLDITDYVEFILPETKVLLAAQGYATLFAIRAANKAPEKYSAYIGISQYTDIWNMQQGILAYCTEEAIKRGEEKDLLNLALLKEAVEYGKESVPESYIKKYIGRDGYRQARKDYILGLMLQPEYNIADAIKIRMTKKDVFQMIYTESKERDVTCEVTSLTIPCLFVFGREDVNFYLPSTDSYMEEIKVPYKEIKVFENAAATPYKEQAQDYAVWLEDAYERVMEEGIKIGH